MLETPSKSLRADRLATIHNKTNFFKNSIEECSFIFSDYWKLLKIFKYILKMKAPTIWSVISFLMIHMNMHLCYAVETSNPIFNILSALSSVTDVGQGLWELKNKDEVKIAMQNYKIHKEMLSANKDIIKTLSDIPQSNVFIEKLENIQENIYKVDKNYMDMLNYYKNYQNISSIARDKMIIMSLDMFLYSNEDGAIRLILEIVHLFAFGSLNILDKLKHESTVCIIK